MATGNDETRVSIMGRVRDVAGAVAVVGKACVFGDRTRRENAIVHELDKLGGLFKKLGQHFSSRPDLVGSELARKLECLRDGRGQPRNPEEELKVRKRVERHLRNLETAWIVSDEEHVSERSSQAGREGDANNSGPFVRFEREPVARGCVAYVYRARLAGTPEVDVAVKVRVPGARKAFQSDARLLGFAARFCGLAGRWWPRKWLPSVPWEEMEGAMSRFSEAIVAQTDLLEEARNLCHFLDQLGFDDPDGRVPVPIVPLSSSKFLVMQWLDGKPLDEAANDCDPPECVRLVEAYMRVIERMVLRDGLLHGDFHPGNVLVAPDGKLVLLDVGISVALTEDMISSCNRSVSRYLRRDWAGCAELMYEESPSRVGDSPDRAEAKKSRLARELQMLESDEWMGIVDFWGRLMRAFDRAGVATDRAFDALGVALLGADALVRNIPGGEQVLFDHLAELRKNPDALSAILRKNKKPENQ